MGGEVTVHHHGVFSWTQQNKHRQTQTEATIVSFHEVSAFGLAVKRYACKQMDVGSTSSPLRLSVLFKSYGLWT